MSKTKEYINNLLESGADVFNDNLDDSDFEYQKFLEESYHWYFEKINQEILSGEIDTFNNWK